MKNKHLVNNLIILDESGSMHSIKKPIIDGFNELAQSLKEVAQKYPEQEHRFSFVSFNTAGRKELFWDEPIDELGNLDESSYIPGGGTPLYDAMGQGILKLFHQLERKKGHHVLVTVLTDGMENASRIFTKRGIKNLIEDLEKQGWTFTYIGTDHDIDSFADSISIKNKMYYGKDQAGVKDLFEKEKNAREEYSRKIRYMEDTKDKFYDDLPW